MDLAIEMATSDNDESPILDAEVSHQDDIHTIGLKLQATINNVLSETLNLLDMQQVQGGGQCTIIKTMFLSLRRWLFGDHCGRSEK